MKVYITQYALTQGILEQDAELCTQTNDTMIRVKIPNSFDVFYHKPFWYEDKQEAINHAEALRNKRIQSLKKSITKIEKIKF